MDRIGNRNLVVTTDSLARDIRRAGEGNVILTVPDTSTAAERLALLEKLVERLSAVGWKPA